MFRNFLDDFTLKILIGERLADELWPAKYLYFGVIAIYFSYLLYKHLKGEATCHHKKCTHTHSIHRPVRASLANRDVR